MATIITRAGKGSPLTNTELDANFTNLNTDLSLYLLKTGGTLTGDITIYRDASPTTGVIYLGNTGSRYLYFDGTNYSMPNGQLDVNGSRVLNAGNYSSYALPLSGGTLSGPVKTNIVAVAALDINCSLGNYFTKTISADSTFTFSSVPTSTAYSFVLELTHTSGTVTWPAPVMWPGVTPPVLTTGKTHLFIFITNDGGDRWQGSSSINYIT